MVTPYTTQRIINYVLYLAPDNTPILLDELDCDKGQNSIFDCEAEWNHHNCNHGEDVIIECYPQQNIIR